MFENGFDRLATLRIARPDAESLRYLVLDRRADETILPVDTVRRSGREQCGPKDNREIPYGH
jgi:hypothetical protein